MLPMMMPYGCMELDFNLPKKDKIYLLGLLSDIPENIKERRIIYDFYDILKSKEFASFITTINIFDFESMVSLKDSFEKYVKKSTLSSHIEKIITYEDGSYWIYLEKKDFTYREKGIGNVFALLLYRDASNNNITHLYITDDTSNYKRVDSNRTGRILSTIGDPVKKQFEDKIVDVILKFDLKGIYDYNPKIYNLDKKSIDKINTSKPYLLYDNDMFVLFCELQMFDKITEYFSNNYDISCIRLDSLRGKRRLVYDDFSSNLENYINDNINVLDANVIKNLCFLLDKSANFYTPYSIEFAKILIDNGVYDIKHDITNIINLGDISLLKQLFDRYTIESLENVNLSDIINIGDISLLQYLFDKFDLKIIKKRIRHRIYANMCFARVSHDHFLFITKYTSLRVDGRDVVYEISRYIQNIKPLYIIDYLCKKYSNIIAKNNGYKKFAASAVISNHIDAISYFKDDIDIVEVFKSKKVSEIIERLKTDGYVFTEEHLKIYKNLGIKEIKKVVKLLS